MNCGFTHGGAGASADPLDAPSRPAAQRGQVHASAWHTTQRKRCGMHDLQLLLVLWDYG